MVDILLYTTTAASSCHSCITLLQCPHSPMQRNTQTCSCSTLLNNSTSLPVSTYLLVAVAELCDIAKVHICNATIPEAEDVAGVWVTMEQAKLQQLA